jgi:hypothetical protein
VANVLASPITGGSGSAEAVVPARVVLVVDVVRATQLSIFEDGTATFSGAVQPGDVKTFRGRSTIEILVGDPEAVKLTLNGAPVPQIAPAGQVGRAKFGPHGRIG